MFVKKLGYCVYEAFQLEAFYSMYKHMRNRDF